jgi:hypothetical protein
MKRIIVILALVIIILLTGGGVYIHNLPKDTLPIVPTAADKNRAVAPPPETVYVKVPGETKFFESISRIIKGEPFLYRRQKVFKRELLILVKDVVYDYFMFAADKSHRGLV